MLSQNRFTDAFKRDAVAQVVDRGYAVNEVAYRLGVSTKSLYTWKAQFAKSPRQRVEGSEQAWADSGKFYGHRKLHDDLRDAG